jgi:hypothetical protein
MTETIQQTTKQISHFDLVYKDAFKHLVNNLEASYDNYVSREIITHKLLDYTFNRGKEALIDLHASIQFAELYQLAYPYIDVYLDLEHADDDGYAARTHGYAVKMYGEGFVNYKPE